MYKDEVIQKMVELELASKSIKLVLEQEEPGSKTARDMVKSYLKDQVDTLTKKITVLRAEYEKSDREVLPTFKESTPGYIEPEPAEKWICRRTCGLRESIKLLTNHYPGDIKQKTYEKYPGLVTFWNNGHQIGQYDKKTKELRSNASEKGLVGQHD